METVKTIKALVGEHEVEVKTIKVQDKSTGSFYYIVPAAEVLRLLAEHTDYLPVMSIPMQPAALALVKATDETSEIEAAGSCVITPEISDPIGVAMKRAIYNFAFLTGGFEDVWDKLRELNGGTLDPELSNKLNDSLEKYLKQ